MNELPVFLSYRRDDAHDVALRLRDELQGRTIFAWDDGLNVPLTVAVYLDQATAPVADWRIELDRELERARSLVVICSPGAAKEFEDDYLYHEIRWWVSNRTGEPPILITPWGRRWIPEPISEEWPFAQSIDLPVADLRSSETGAFRLVVERVLGGVRRSVESAEVKARTLILPAELVSDGPVNIPGLYTWEKDKHFRYIRCNENYARAAGFDSPEAMIGKTDDEMPWRSLADFFREGDQGVIDAESPARIHVEETEIMVDRVADILVTENQLLSRTGACVGVTGYFLDISGKTLVSNPMNLTSNREISLGPQFDGQSLTMLEAAVLKGLLRKLSVDLIASSIGVKKSEVRSTIKSIMIKLQCETNGDVIATAIRAGLPLYLFGLS